MKDGEIEKLITDTDKMNILETVVCNLMAENVKLKKIVLTFSKLYPTLIKTKEYLSIDFSSVACSECGGHGEVSKPPYDDSEICPNCKGSGDSK